MNSNSLENTAERAAKFIDAAKISQEQLWKRRHIEWRTGFALWTALAVSSAFIYRYAKRPLPDPEKWIFLVLIFVLFCAIVWLHRKHLKAIFISNERDLDFFNYYSNRAAWELCHDDFVEKPERPVWANGPVKSWSNKNEESQYYTSRKSKMRHHYTPVAVTIFIALLSWCLLALMCVES